MFIVRVNGLHPDHSTYTTWGLSCISLLDAPCDFFACQYFLSLHNGDVAKVLLLPRRTRHVWSNCVLVHQWVLVFRCTYSAFVPFPQLLARVATLDSLRWWGAGQMRSAHQTDWIRLVLFFNILYISIDCHVSMYFPYISWFSDGVSTKFQPFYKDNFHIGRWCLRMVPPSLVRPIACEWQTNDACSPARRWKKLAGSGTCGACKQVKCMDGGGFWILVGGYIYIIYIIYYIHFILYIIYCNLYTTYFIYIYNIIYIHIIFYFF